jgi:spore maturation protein CgeB
MKIVLVCMAHDYGDPARGNSYEYYNFYQSLKALGHEVTLFDFMAEIKSSSKREMNEKLFNLIKDSKPDFAMFSLYTDQFDPNIVRRMGDYVTTLCFFHDDNWRKEFVQQWAPNFKFFTSTDYAYKSKYLKKGLSNVIHFPFGANEQLYKPLSLSKKYDLSFVGGWNPTRAWLIDRLRKAGFSVTVAGYGWPAGIIEHEAMVRMFNESRINLNLTNSRCWDVRMLLTQPVSGFRQLLGKKNIEQIKARHFEINACGAFQLTYYVEGLERAYRIGEEIAIYADADEMIDKVRYYLEDDDLRENIAHAGYMRTMSDHTFEQRFSSVFEQMGLSWKIDK